MTIICFIFGKRSGSEYELIEACILFRCQDRISRSHGNRHLIFNFVFCGLVAKDVVSQKQTHDKEFSTFKREKEETEKYCTLSKLKRETNPDADPDTFLIRSLTAGMTRTS